MGGSKHAAQRQNPTARQTHESPQTAEQFPPPWDELGWGQQTRRTATKPNYPLTYTNPATAYVNKQKPNPKDTMTDLIIIDTGCANLFSVQAAFARLGCRSRTSARRRAAAFS